MNETFSVTCNFSLGCASITHMKMKLLLKIQITKTSRTAPVLQQGRGAGKGQVWFLPPFTHADHSKSNTKPECTKFIWYKTEVGFSSNWKKKPKEIILPRLCCAVLCFWCPCSVQAAHLWPSWLLSFPLTPHATQNTVWKPQITLSPGPTDLLLWASEPGCPSSWEDRKFHLAVLLSQSSNTCPALFIE